MDKLEKEKKICEELENLKDICKGIDANKQELVYKLCDKAAFLKVSIEECQDDINQNGYYEKFQQSKGVEPYDRTRPVVNTYVSFTSSYQKYIKQITDLMPEEKRAEAGDGFDSFTNKRDKE